MYHHFLGYTSAMNSDLFEGNVQLIQSLLDALLMISEINIYLVEVSNAYLKLLQVLSVTTWTKYPFQIGKTKKSCLRISLSNNKILGY